MLHSIVFSNMHLNLPHPIPDPQSYKETFCHLRQRDGHYYQCPPSGGFPL